MTVSQHVILGTLNSADSPAISDSLKFPFFSRDIGLRLYIQNHVALKRKWRVQEVLVD